MESNSNNSGLKAAVVVLALLLLASIGYIYKITSDTKKEVTELTSEKDTLAEELKAKIAEYDLMIADNTALKDEIQAEQAKMVALLEQVEKSKGDAAAMAKYKGAYLKLKGEMDNLVAENKLLKEQNVTLTSSLDSTKVVLDDAKKFNDTLLVQNANNSNSRNFYWEMSLYLFFIFFIVYGIKYFPSDYRFLRDMRRNYNLVPFSYLNETERYQKIKDRLYCKICNTKISQNIVKEEFVQGMQFVTLECISCKNQVKERLL